MKVTEQIPLEWVANQTPATGLSSVMVDASCYSLSYDYSLCDALLRQGCEATLACSEFVHEEWKLPGSFRLWKHFYRATHAYARTHPRGYLWKIAKAAEHIVDMRGFVAEMKKLKRLDVIHFQWLPLPMLDKVCLPALHRIAPLVLTLHNTTIFHGAPASSLQAVGFRSAISHFDAVIVHSEFSKRRAVEQGWIAADKIQVIPHGSLEYYRSIASQPQSPPTGESNILFFGNLKAYKGVDILIRAFAQLPDSIISSTRLVIAGKPMMDVTPLRQMAHALGIDGRITWKLGHVKEEDVPDLFQSATVVALPYREIDQSGVLMTAVAFEKAVVASRVGGIAETIQDGIHGYLVEPEDVTGLTAALTAVLGNSQRRLSMEKAVGGLRKGVLSWDHIARKTIQLYTELLRDRCS